MNLSRLGCITLWPPQEAQETLILVFNEALVEHQLDITNYSDRLFAKADENTSQTVQMVWTLKYDIVERDSIVLRNTIKDDSTLAWIRSFENCMMRQEPLASLDSSADTSLA